MSDKNELNCTEQDCPTTALATRRVPTYKPRYSSRYDEEAWEVAVDLPGVRKEAVSVTVENEILDIDASRSFELPEGWRPVRNQANERTYRLRLDVGPEVDDSSISARMEDGVLKVRLPLRAEVKPRSIQVN